jgi:hypothetical protein
MYADREARGQMSIFQRGFRVNPRSSASHLSYPVSRLHEKMKLTADTLGAPEGVSLTASCVPQEGLG